MYSHEPHRLETSGLSLRNRFKLGMGPISELRKVSVREMMWTLICFSESKASRDEGFLIRPLVLAYKTWGVSGNCGRGGFRFRKKVGRLNLGFETSFTSGEVVLGAFH
jgi:hypothetical protein